MAYCWQKNSPDMSPCRGERFRKHYDRENVVSAAGAPHRFTYKTMQDAIKEAGFEPQLRNQQYGWRQVPELIEEQVINLLMNIL